MNTKLWVAGLAVAFSLAGASPAVAQDQKDPVPFGSLESMPASAVQAKALAWLKTATNNDAAKLAQAQTLWARADRSVLDNLADTFALGNGQAADLLKVVRDPAAPPPLGVPVVLTDAKADMFFRANLGLAVARQLSNRRVYEEALNILNGFAPEQTVEPATYLFHKAISEHAMLKKNEANSTIVRLIQDSVDSPERYKTVGALMMLDMQTWKKDLGNVARLMDNSERRLEVGRGGPQTQKIQKEVIARLDELIKELENKAKKSGGGGGGGGGQPNDGSCPDGDGPGNGQGSKGGPNPTSPMQDTNMGLNGGPGNVDVAKLRKLTESWGNLPPGEKAKVQAEIQDLVSGLSPVHREAFERYFEEISQQNRGAIPPKKD
ncbi:MAG TPA: hypothetical protein VE988_14390 [Gemmataceae bacterium]|nr:hypothetical protein [Gemmataceae bacterium]